MAMKPQSDPLWGQILTGSKNPELKSLATRLVVTRLRQSLQNKSMTVGQATSELHRFVAENDFAQRDLQLN
ncbi:MULTISPECIES: hypothetical protein [unclassified Aureimonas]|uniref:hypothetical protein n=1 Tax=unclassified Aureimonas TaxID=2615206 RepID=UPI0006FEF602|nr:MULTISPECIES: hypothetical protein [unclassified Aureimonas]KQT55198.1 hypothetical protein ASG62_10180 [Aureimonas sp. Leaf427]KQT70988.1 hypothetical protein ASG54_20565 [Aureimonas sp. Leaf460]